MGYLIDRNRGRPGRTIWRVRKVIDADKVETVAEFTAQWQAKKRKEELETEDRARAAGYIVPSRLFRRSSYD